MLRRVLAVILVLVSLAACGGSSATETPSEAPVSVAPSVSQAPSTAPTAPPAPSESFPRTVTAQCSGIALRADPSVTGSLVARVSTGAKLRAAELVTGGSYTAGSCGTGGDTWYRISKVGSKTVKSLYGATDVYTAAGFFK